MGAVYPEALHSWLDLGYPYPTAPRAPSPALPASPVGGPSPALPEQPGPDPGPAPREACRFPLVARGREPLCPAEDRSSTWRDERRGRAEHSERVRFGAAVSGSGPCPVRLCVGSVTFPSLGSLWVTRWRQLFDGAVWARGDRGLQPSPRVHSSPHAPFSLPRAGVSCLCPASLMPALTGLVCEQCDH